jgi:hypothetical protein
VSAKISLRIQKRKYRQYQIGNIKKNIEKCQQNVKNTKYSFFQLFKYLKHQQHQINAFPHNMKIKLIYKMYDV